MFKRVLYCFLLALLTPSVFGGICMFHEDPTGGYACRLENGAFFNRTDGFTIQGAHLPGRTDQDVRMLFTLNSNMWRVPQQIFDRFPNLVILRLIDLDLRHLDELWGNCGNLNDVVFNNNTISILPSNVFQLCNNLESLTFSGCRIQQIATQAFGGPQLKTLRIVDNGFAMGSLSLGVFQQPLGMRRLELNNIGLHSIGQATFHSLRNLGFISLNDNQISSVPFGTFSGFPLLQTIQFRGNRVPTWFSNSVFVNLNSLQTLDFQDSNISSLSRWSFGLLPTLVNLNLRNTSLVLLSEASFFENFPNLGNLDVQSNICINRTFVEAPRLQPGFVNYFGDCFNPWGTTQGASSVQSSLALILSVVILIKLRF